MLRLICALYPAPEGAGFTAHVIKKLEIKLINRDILNDKIN